ncbi:hypothetical protein [Bacillus sp. ISL-47]|uniref:hypothetical protein n=1 Tax=Bacillus sp. ISL-47 TaxID=2819130 RepID=UPI001BEB6C04|nr:hypothetical protein [Bacillus sp. ISL-47]MBT2710969.1 hypothetical protein [Pseudomonas sp. ISL-84]
MKKLLVLIVIAAIFNRFPNIIHAADSPEVSSGTAILMEKREKCYLKRKQLIRCIQQA